MNKNVIVISILVLCTHWICSVQADPFVVGLYPWLNDISGDNFANWTAWLTTKYNQDFPGDDVQFRMLGVNDESYEPDVLAAEFANGSLQLAEIDTTLLAEIVATNTIESNWVTNPLGANEWPSNIGATVWQGQDWGVSRFRCSLFVYSKDPLIVSTRGLALQSLLLKLQLLQPKKLRQYLGSFDMPMAYMSTARQYNAPNLNTITTDDPATSHPAIVRLLEKYWDRCESVGESFNTSQCYRDVADSDPSCDAFCGGWEQQVVSGQLTAVIGYLERLYTLNSYLAQAGIPRNMYSSVLKLNPMGPNSKVYMYSDAFVKAASCSSTQCKAIANRVVEFMNSPPVWKVFLNGEDAGGQVYRTSLPATHAAFDVAGIATNPFYQQVRHQFTYATTLPPDFSLKADQLFDKLATAIENVDK